MKRWPPVRERFDADYIVVPSGCWIWTGSSGGHGGYGQIYRDGRLVQAHRVSYELYVGSIPTGYEIDHLCREKRCVNWRHLEAVTPLENFQRSLPFRPRKTHCRNGHPFDVYGHRQPKAEGRVCRACQRDKYQRRGSDYHQRVARMDDEGRAKMRAMSREATARYRARKRAGVYGPALAIVRPNP